jgi:hypothetical protein
VENREARRIGELDALDLRRLDASISSEREQELERQVVGGEGLELELGLT